MSARARAPAGTESSARRDPRARRERAGRPMMAPLPAVVPPLPRAGTWNRNLAPAAAFDWLRAGWRDFTIDPAASISYGLLVFLVSVVTTVGLFALRWDFILLPAFAGFMVVGPIIGIGL